jgi:hypothetical protein
MVGEGRIITMARRRRHTPEQIIRKLREADLRRLDEAAPRGATAGDRYPAPMMSMLNG